MKIMKYIVGILMVLCAGTIYAQKSVNNFSVNDREVVWQKVFDTDCTFDEVKTILMESGKLEIKHVGENKILADLKPVRALYRELGYGRLTTTIYLIEGYFRAFAVIEYKENRYRVTLKKISVNTYTETVNDGEVITDSWNLLSTYCLKNRKESYKSGFKNEDSKILDHTFNKSFKIKKSTEDNW